MKLKNFSAKNVHGFLNYDISFRDNVTFLIGINGTGKTSVLKLILGLISPSYNYLNQIDFGEARLECEYSLLPDYNIFEVASQVGDHDTNQFNHDLVIGEKKTVCIVISAVRKDSIIMLSLEINGKVISGELVKFNSSNNVPSEESREKLNFHRQKFEEEEVYSEIKKLTTPLFLGIDRKIYEGHNIDRGRPISFNLRKKLMNFPTNDPLNLSLIEVQGLLYDYYRIIAAKQPTINEKFKNKIFAQTFDFIEGNDNDIVSDFKEIKYKRDQVQEAIKDLHVGDFQSQIDTFFDKMEYVLREYHDIQDNKTSNKEYSQITKQLEIIQRWFSNKPQLNRINQIIAFSQSYKAEIDALYEPVNSLKSLINHFFNESKKNIEIDDKGEIKIFFSNGKHAELFQLSSGEKQIISMLANLIFFQMKFDKDGGIFIIDEPELSLHLAWQEIFVENMRKASPNTQFIMATHSPAIIAEYGDEFCEDLIKLN